MAKKLNVKLLIVICLIVVSAVFIIIASIFGITTLINNNQLKNAKHSIAMKENVCLYKSPNSSKSFKSIALGTDVLVMDEVLNHDGEKWNKVKVDDKIGYVRSNEIDSFESTTAKKTLMLDVSKYNFTNNFSSIEEFKVFVLENNIQFVYIRAGGRGYGKAGNFYYDQDYKKFAEACEYLNVPFGFYFLEEALNSEEIDEEIKFISDFINDNKYLNNVLPVALDVEKHEEKGRTDDIWDTRYLLLTEMVEKMEAAKMSVIVYSNANLASKYLTNLNAKMWLAYYPKVVSVPHIWLNETKSEAATNNVLLEKVVGWQFTESGVKGVINESLDLSVVYTQFFQTGETSYIYCDMYYDILGENHLKKYFEIKYNGYKCLAEELYKLTKEKGE